MDFIQIQIQELQKERDTLLYLIRQDYNDGVIDTDDTPFIEPVDDFGLQKQAHSLEMVKSLHQIEVDINGKRLRFIERYFQH